MKKKLNEIFDEAKPQEFDQFSDELNAPELPDEVLASVKGKVYAKTNLKKEVKTTKSVWLRFGAIAACFLLIVSAVIVVPMLREDEPGVIQEPGTTNNWGDKAEQNPGETINVRSIEELNYMRSMLLCTDNEMLANYLRSIEGGGAHSKEDIEKFIDIVDSVPIFKIIEGDISWISYSTGQSNETGDPYEILYISIQSNKEDWVRFEYMLSVTDVAEEAASKAEKITANTIASKPISSKDERITFYSEVREKHVSGIGDTIQWIATIDGIYTNIVYYSTSANVVDTNEVVNNIQVSNLSKMQ